MIVMIKISFESLQEEMVVRQKFADCENPEEQLVMREMLISSVKQLFKGLQEKA